MFCMSSGLGRPLASSNLLLSATGRAQRGMAQFVHQKRPAHLMLFIAVHVHRYMNRYRRVYRAVPSFLYFQCHYNMCC